MAVRYFKVGAVRTKRYASTGQLIAFTPVSMETGVLATNNEQLIKELDTCIAETRGGYSSITEQEYQQLKKNPILITPWREEIGSRGVEHNKVPLRNLAQQNQRSIEVAERAVAADKLGLEGAEAESQPDAGLLERPKAVPKK